MSNLSKTDRTLTLIPVVLFGFSFMGLTTAFTTYGIAANISHGTVPGAMIVALVVMMFTAYSYGKMAIAFPSSGSAYVYTQKSLNPSVGFLVGWVILMDYLFMPMVNYLVFGIFFSAAFPTIPSYIWILGMLILVTFINIKGLKIATNVNAFITIFAFLFIVIFIGFSIKETLMGESTATLLSLEPFYNSKEPFSYTIAGAALLCFCFLGFESVTAFAEETVNPKKTIPRAVILITLGGGLIFTSVSYFSYLVWPEYNTFNNPDSAAYEIIKLVGGKTMYSVYLALYALAVLGSAMSSQASASRVLYTMGRDGQFPKKFFGSLHPRYKTPVNNILIISFVSLLALFLSLDLVASFINFGAFLAYTCVNISVIAHYYIRNRERSVKGTVLYLFVPIIGAALDILLLVNLDAHSKVLGVSWLIIGFIYLLVLTKGLKKQPPVLKIEENYSVDLK
ncbi:APC family permease [Peribacillus frigoritolerans]|uniref:APC family permease n=1 Tax=Peribacillus frigoritolerans TaxID=450367 RepID=A0AAJ1VDP7_9BACI|nr:APC family permease [Peribacillus frigoritolerans]MDM5285870.1 APC family permease [Peribacillus frigoritolerans]MDM5307839.1 APC family permease [Peribacillus frigoritolerans]USK63804.1 APC family permease [Peribacillus frigoritolerans]USK79149.1 APC family permease [Peribacillus frigoritolerans]